MNWSHDSGETHGRSVPSQDMLWIGMSSCVLCLLTNYFLNISFGVSFATPCPLLHPNSGRRLLPNVMGHSLGSEDLALAAGLRGNWSMKVKLALAVFFILHFSSSAQNLLNIYCGWKSSEHKQMCWKITCSPCTQAKKVQSLLHTHRAQTVR